VIPTMAGMEPFHWSTHLPRGACGDAIAWCQTQPSYEQAWDACERADWLLWLASWLCDRKLVVLAACGCARTALKYVPEGEVRPRVAIETAEAWCRGEATIEQVRIAADAAAAADAASAAYADAAASAASTAAYAAYVAYVAYVAYAAANAANAANAAANAAAYADARSKALLDMATLVRSMIPRPELP
jgi:hypothetical protein